VNKKKPMTRNSTGKSLAAAPSSMGEKTSQVFSSSWPYLALIAVICAVFFNKVVLGQAFFWEDMIYQEFPHRIFAHDNLLSGNFPFWNPYTFGGMPFFAAIHTGVLYPTNLLLSFLPFSHDVLWYLLELFTVLHLAIAGMTMFYLCRCFSASRNSSLFAACSYMLCGFFVVHVIHSLILSILAWLPLIMAFLKKGTESGKLIWFLYCGVVLGVSIFAGHPQITFYECLFLGAYGIYLFIASGKKGVPLAFYLVLPFLIGAGLSMVQLLPSAELGNFSARTNWTFEQVSEGSMSVRQLLTFFIPKLFGGTNAGDSELTFWLKDAYHSGYWTFWETTFYMGIPVMLLGFLMFKKIKRNYFGLFMLVWCALSLMVALGNHTPFYQFLYKFVPGFHQFRIPARILFSWNILVPLSAALIIDECAKKDAFKVIFKYAMIGAGILAVIGIAVASGFIASVWPEFAIGQNLAYAKKQALFMLLIDFAFAGTLLLYYKDVVNHGFFQAVLTGVLLLDLFIFGMNYHIVNYSAPQYFQNRADLARQLKTESDKGPMRINMRKGGSMVLDRNQGMIDKLQLLEGYNPLCLDRHLPPSEFPAAQWPDHMQLDLMNTKIFLNVDEAQGAMSLAFNPTMLPRASVFFRARTIQDDSLLKRYMLSKDFDYHKEVVLEKPLRNALPSDSSLGPVDALVTHYENNAFEVATQSSHNGILLLSEVYYPAWRATVDGKPVETYRADYCLRAIEIPAGRHTVACRYASKAFGTGLIISLATLMVCFGIFAGCRRKRPSNSPHAKIKPS
jgi:hypothetical protein